MSHEIRSHLARHEFNACFDWTTSAVSLQRNLHTFRVHQRTSSLIFAGVEGFTEKGYDVCDEQNVTRGSIQMYISELVFAVLGNLLVGLPISRQNTTWPKI